MISLEILNFTPLIAVNLLAVTKSPSLKTDSRPLHIKFNTEISQSCPFDLLKFKVVVSPMTNVRPNTFLESDFD